MSSERSRLREAIPITMAVVCIVNVTAFTLLSAILVATSFPLIVWTLGGL